MHVVVLGAGVVGVATAYNLARDGHDVTVIEREAGPAMGCSHANAGLINGHTAVPWSAPGIPAMVLKEFWRDDAPYRVRLRADPAMALWIARFFGNCTPARTREIKARLRRLSTYSFERLQALRAAENIDYDAQTNGLIYLYRDPDALGAAQQAAAAGSDPRAHPIRLSLEETLEREPALRRTTCRYAGALLYDKDETGDARLFTEGLSRAAVQRGARFLFGQPVTAIRTEGNKVCGVGMAEGDLDADAVVVAAGTGSARLLGPFGVRLPVYPVKGYSATVEAGDRSTLPRHALQDVQRKITMTPLGSRLRAAGTAELAGHNTTIDARRAGVLHTHMRAMLPDAAGDAVPTYWAGLRPMTPDSLPILGATPVDGLWLNTGHGSLGWTMACGSGRVIADLVAGKPSPINLDGLSLR
ncbi:MAG: D-amino acid dehydrogenase [Proteobacteria bacterium]|nr:D-amino acid dehydrogenase [Pseudomonadota bacterium]MDA1057647.1 D-amino acid dehydrogenase [Pseudomonadota bacterium]